MLDVLALGDLVALVVLEVFRPDGVDLGFRLRVLDVWALGGFVALVAFEVLRPFYVSDGGFRLGVRERLGGFFGLALGRSFVACAVVV